MSAPIRRAQLDADIPLGATKDPCRLATTADDSLSGLAARDGVTPVANDRVLVKNQSTGSQNGIYLAAAGAWQRAPDFATDDDLDSGSLFPVSEGTANADTCWQLTTNAPLILDTTGLTFGIATRATIDPGAHGTRHDPDGADEITTAAPPAASVSAAAAGIGTATSVLRSDAALQLDVSGTRDDLTVGQAGSDGAGDGAALKTHAHAVPAATAIEITDSTNNEGSGGNFVHANHSHAHGNRGGAALHAAATGAVNGFLSAADKTKLDSIVDPRFRDFKESVQLKAQGDIATLSGEQTLDGVLTSASRVALFNQTTTTEDGLYLTAAGAWTREPDFQSGDGVAGAFFAVREGTVDGDRTWLVTNDVGSDVVGTDDLSVVVIGNGSPRGAGAGMVLNVNDLDVVANADGSLVVNADDMQVGVLATDAQHGVRGGGTQHADVVAAGADGFMTGADKTRLDGIETGATAEIFNQESVTTETITNSDTALTDTLNATPKANASLLLFLNGIQQRQGAGFDYSISGTTITWLASTGTAVNMKTSDTLIAYYVS